MKLKKRTIRIAGLILLLLIAVAICLSVFLKKQEVYSFKGDKFIYSQDRGTPLYSLNQVSVNNSFIVYKVEYDSRSFLDQKVRIYGFIVIPKDRTNFPGLVLLPGGAVPKEGELILAQKIAEQGIAVITIDQRGVGETKAAYLGYEQDYQIFSQGKEPMQHEAVYDALGAFDVLREIKGINKSNIAVAGESMGGRYAIIAAAIEPRFKGLIGISTSGFGVKKDASILYNTYLLSVDPDNYIKDISPRPVYMFHSKNDSTIPIANAKATFDLAGEPKKFFVVENCPHGYCEAMLEELKKSLTELFGK